MWKFLVSMALCLGVLIIQASGSSYTLSSYIAGNDPRTWSTDIFSILSAETMILSAESGVSFVSCQVFFGATDDSLTEESGTSCGIDNSAMTCRRDVPQRGRMRLVCEVRTPSVTSEGIVFRLRDLNNPESTTEFTSTQSIVESMTGTIVPSHYLAEAENTLTISFTTFFNAPAGSDLVFAFHPHVNSHSCEFSGAMFQDQSSTGAKTSEPLASHAQLTIQCVVVIGALDEPPVESFVFGGYPVVIGALSRSIAYYSISASSTGFTPGTPHTMTLQLTSLMVSDIGSQYSFDIDPTISVLPDDITCESPSDCIPSLNAENTITLEYASRRDAGHAITFSFDFKFLGNFSESVGTMRTNLISDTMERSAQIDSLPHPVMEYTDAGHQPTMVLSTYSNRDIGTFSIKIIALQQYLTGINLRVSLNSLFTVAQSDVDSCLTEPSMPITVSLGNGLISITLGDGVNILFGETFSISCSMTTGAGTLAENVSPGTVILSSLSIADQVAPIEPLNVAIGPAVTMSQPDGYLVNTGMNVAFAIQLPRYVMAGDQFVLSISGTLTMDENTECISNIVRTGTSVTAYDFSSFVHGSRADNKPHVVTFQASLDMSINDEPVFLCRILFPNIGYKGKNIAKGHFVGPDEQPLALVEWATEWSEQIRSYSASATLSSYLAGHENSNIRIEFTTLLPGEAMDLEDRGWVITLNPAFELKDLPCQFENQISGSVVANAEANEIHVHLFNKMPSLSVVSFSCQTKNLEPLEGSPATFAVDEEHFFNVNPLPVAVTHYTGQVTLSSYKTDVTSILTVQVVSLHQAANWEFKVNPLLRLQGNSPCETQDATLKLTFSNSDSYVVTVTPKSGDVIRPRYTISFTCQAKNPANPYDGENPVTLTVDTFTAALGPLPHQISSQPSSKAWLNSYVAGVETKLFVSVFLIESVPENTQFAFTLDPLYVRNGDCSVFKQPNDALVTVTGTSLKAPTGGFRTGELVLQCPVKNPDTIEENYLNAAKVKIGSASDIPSLLPFTPTLTGDSSASVTSYETSSNQQLTIYVSVPSAFKHKTDQVFVLHSAFSNVHSCEIIEATDSLIARATISVSGVTVTVTPWSEGLIMGNANYKLRCYVITPSGPIKNSPIATFKFTTADGEKQSFEVKRPDRDFAKYEASSVLLSYFEYASTNYEVSFKTLLTFPGAATLTLSFSKKLTQSGGACRIITPAGQRSQKSFSSATKNNVAVFDLPSGDDVELGKSITLRCPVKNPAASSSSFVATVKISNGFNANTEFTVDPLPLDVFASYAKAPALFESRMVRYYAEKPTTVYFQFPLLESTASGSVYNFVIDNAITFEDSASNPCKGDNLAVTQPDNDKRKVRVELTKNLASGTKIRLECNVLAPHADSEPSGSMAKVTFTAASAPQVGTFPELVSKTSIDNELTVSVQTLSRGEDNNVVFSFPVLDDLAKSTAVHLVLNQAFKGTGTCTWSDTTVDEDATKITNRFVIDFIVSKTIYAGAHASITCKFKNPNRAIGLTETPFEVFFNISPEEEVRLLHSIDIDLVPGFSGTTKLSVYTQQPVVTLTMWLAFPRAINSGELTMTLHSNLAMTSGSGCVLVNGNYTDPDIVTLKHDPPTSQVLSLAFTSFPLGGHLTIECKVSTENADQNSFDAVITSAATLDPSVSSFKIADLPFPIIGTAVAQTYLSSIISESYARLINSFWLVSPVPDATLFLFSIPKSTFEFRVCDLFDEAHSVVSLAPTDFQEDGSDYVVHTNITALPAGTRLTCECIVKLPAKGEPFSLTYGPIVMKPPDGDNIFVTVPDLPHAPIEMPPAPGPGFLSSLLFSKSQTMPLEFIIVDSITANGIIMVDVNAQFIDVACSASAMGGLITLLPSDPTKPSSFSFQFPEGFHAGSLVRFGCQVVLPNAELTSLVAAVVSYDYEAVDKEGDNYETATRSVEFKLLSNIREKYTVSVELNTFKTNVETNLHLSYHVLDSDLTKEESVMELAVHGAVAFKENAECTGSNIRGSKITPVAATGTTGSPMTLLEVKVNLDAFLGQEVTIVCPIKTPSSEGSLDGPLVSLKSIKPVMSVDIRNPPYPFVETFETTTQLSSIRPGNAIVHFHFWLYEAAGSEYDNLFTIPIKTAMIESVKSCVVEDENGSDDIFENLEIGSAGSSGGNDLFISFNMALSERAGQSVTLSCNVVITENEDEDMPLEVGPATLAGWTISFPPLPHHPVQRYDIVPTFSSFYGNQKATISFSFLLLSELTSRNNFVLIVDPDFIGKKADTPCTAEPDIFNIMSPYAGAHRFEVKTNMHVFAGTTVLVGCDFILRQHISAPFTPAYFTIGSSSTPYPSRQVDVSVEDSYSGTFHFSSLLRNRPSKVTLTFVALEGLKQDTPVTVTFKAPVSIASDAVCDFEGMTVSEISPGADISSVTIVATNDISPGTKVTGFCNVLIDNNLETISVLSFQFPHSATETREGRFMSNIQFDLSPSYVVESVLDNYNPGVETSLHLSMVVLEDIYNDTLDVVPTSSLFSGVTCESKSHNGDRQSSAKFFFTEVKAGETVLFSCTVTTKATSGPAGSPAMITRTTSAAAPAGQALQIPAKGLTLPISKESGLNSHLSSFLASSQATMELEMNLLQSIPANSTNVRSEVLLTLPPAFEPTSCHFDDFVLSITGSIASFFPKRKINAGRRILISCNLNTPLSSETFPDPVTLSLLKQSPLIVFPAFLQQQTFDNYFGLARLADYTISKSTLFTLSFVALTGLVQSDSVSFGVPTLSLSSCSASGSGRPIATVDFSASTLTLNFGAMEEDEVAVQAGGLVTVSCSVTNPEAPTPLTTVTSNSNIIGGSQTTITFDPFPMNIVATMPLTSYLKSYYAGSPSLFVIEFQPVLDLAAETRIEWSDPTFTGITCTLFKQAPGDDEFVKINSPIVSAVSGGTQMRLSCYLRTLSAGLPLNLSIQAMAFIPPAGASTSFPLAKLLTTFKSAPEVTENLKLWYLAASTESYITTTFKTLQYYFPGDEITITVGKAFSKPSSDAFSTILIDSESSNSSAEQLEWIGQKLTYVVPEIIPADTPIHLSIAVLNPSEDDDFTGIASVVNITQGSEHIYSYEIGKDVTISDEKFSAELSTYYSGAPSVTATVTFMITEVWQASTANPAMYEFFYDPDSGTSCAIDAATSSDSSLEWTKQSSTISSSSQTATIGTTVTVIFTCSPAMPVGTTSLFTSVTFKHPSLDVSYTRPVVLSEFIHQITDAFIGDVTTSNYMQGEEAELRVHFWAIMPLCSAGLQCPDVILMKFGEPGSGVTIADPEENCRLHDGTAERAPQCTPGTEDLCNNKGVRFNLQHKVDAGVSMRIVCKNVRNPPTASFGPIVVKGTLGSLTFAGSASDKFKFIRVPTYLSALSPLETKVRLTTYRQEASSTMIMSWMMVTDMASNLVITLRSGLFTNVDECSAEDDIGQGKGDIFSSIVSTKDKITFNGFKSFGGSTIVLKCSVKTGKQGTELSAGSMTVNGMAYHFTLPMRIVDSYDGTVSLSSLTAHESAVVTFEFLTFADFMGRTFSILPGIFSEEDAALVSCTSDFSSASSFTNITFTENTLPDSMITVTCTGPLGTKGSYDVTATISGEDANEEEDYTFGSVTIVDMVDVFFETDSRVASDNCSFTISFIAPIAMDGYSVVFTTADWFSDVEDCSTGFGTIELSEPASDGTPRQTNIKVDFAGVGAGTEVVISCHVTNTIASRARFSSGDFAIQSGPNIMFEGSFASIYSDLGGVLTRDSTIEGSMTTFTMMFDAPDMSATDRVVLKINTGTTIRNLTSGCDISTLSPDQSLSTSIGVLSESSVSGFEIEFEGSVITSLSSLTMVCEGQNGDHQTNVMWDAAYWIRGSSRLPVVFAPFDIESSTVFGEILLSTTRAGRLDIPVKIVFSSRLPVAGYSLEFDLADILTSFGENCNEVTQVIGGGPVKVGDVVVSDTKLSLSFLDLAKVDSQFLISCQCNLGDEAENNNPLVSTFEPPSANLPSFIFSLELPNIVDVVKITAALSVYYVQASSKLTVPILPPENFANWIFSINFGTTFQSVSSCTVKDEDGNSVIVENSMTVMSDESSSVKFTFHSDELTSLALLVCDAVNGERSEVKWSASAELSGMPSFEFEVTMSPIVHTPPEIDAVLSSSVFNDVPVTLTLEFVLTFDLNATDSLSFNLFDLFKMDKISCSLTSSADADRKPFHSSATAGSEWEITFAYFETSAIAAGAKLTVVCENLRNPANSAAIVPVTGRLADGVPLVFSVSNEFVDQAPAGTVTTTSYTAGTKDELMTFTFKPPRDLKDYVARIESKPHFDLLNDCRLTEGSSQSQVAHEGPTPVRTILMTILSSTVIGQDTSFLCDVNLGIPAPAGTIEIAFSNTVNSNEIVIPFSIREYVPAPDFTGSFSSSLLGDKNVYAKFTATAGFTIPANAKLYFGFPTSFATIACDLIFGSTTQRLTRNAEVFPFTVSEPIPVSTTLTLECTSISLPATAGFSLSSRIETEAFGTIPFLLSYTNDMRKEYAEGKAILDSYLPEVQTTLHATIVPLKNLKSTTLRLNMLDKKDNANSGPLFGFIQSCDNFDGKFSSTPQAGGLTAIDITVNVDTEVDVPLTLVCDVTTNVATNADGFIALELIGSSGTAETTVHLAINAIIKSLEGTLSLTSTVSGEPSTATFIVSNFDSDFETTKLVADLSTMAYSVENCSVPVNTESYATVSMDFPFVTMVFNTKLEGQSLSWSCDIINGTPEDSYTVTVKATDPAKPSSNLPLYFPHPGIQARLLTAAAAEFNGPRSAGSRTSIVFTAKPNFAVSGTMIFAFPIPEHASNTTSDWPLTCSATVNSASVSSLTFSTVPFAFTFSGVSATMTGAEIVFTCINFPLPLTPFITPTPILAATLHDIDAIDAFLAGDAPNATNGIIAVLETSFPAYPASTDSDFGGRLAHIEYVSSTPNSFTGVRFSAAPTILTTIAKDTIVRAELAYGVSLRSSDVSCTLSSGEYTISGRTTSALRTPQGVIVIEWEAGAASPLDPDTQVDFLCESVVLPADLMDPQHYGSLTVGSMTVTKMITDEIKSAPLSDITSTFTPNQIGTPSAVFAISHIGIDLVPGNTIVLPVPGSTIQTKDTAITCRFDGGLAISALLDVSRSHLTLIVPKDLNVPPSASLACAGLQPPQSTLARIGNSAFLHIYASSAMHIEELIGNGTVASPIISPRIFDNDDTMLTIISDESDTPASFFVRKATVELSVAALPFDVFASSARVTLKVPSDMFFTGTCKFGNIDEDNYDPNRIPVDVSTTDGVALFTFARSMSQYIPSIKKSNTAQIYRITCPPAAVTLPDYILEDQSTLTVDVSASIGDKISSTTTGRIRGGPSPDIGAVTVSTAPWLGQTGGFVVSWDMHSIRFAPSDVVIIDMEMDGQYVFNTPRCSVLEPPADITVVATQSSIELTFGDFVDPAPDHRFLISCPSVLVPSNLGEEPQSPGSLRVLRNGDPTQLKINAPDSVSFTVLTPEPNDLVEIDVTFEPPSDMSGSKGTAKINLFSSEIEIPAQAILSMSIPRTMWSFPDPLECTGSVAGSAASTVVDSSTQITFTFGDNVPKNTKFVLSCRNARATAVYRAGATVSAIVRLNGKEIAMDKSIEIPPLLGVVGVGASIVFLAPTTGAVGTVDVDVPEIAATIVGAITIVVSVPPGTFMSDDTSVCTATTSGGEATVLAAVIATDDATFTSALAATIDVGSSLTIGASVSFSCTNVRSTFIPTPAAVDGPENPYVVYVHLADGSPAARGAVSFGGIKAITELSEMDVSFSTTAGARAGLVITLAAPGFALPVNSRFSLRIAKEAARVDGATRCAINGRFDALLEPVDADDEGAVAIVAAEEVPSSVEIIEVLCPNAFDLPNYEVKWTSTRMKLMLPYGENSTLVDTFDLDVPHSGVLPAVLSVSVSPADARVAIKSELVFSILPTSLDAVANDVLEVTGPVLFDYIVDKKATCELQGEKGSTKTKIDISTVDNSDGVHTSYTLSFPNGLKLSGRDRVIISCGPVTTPSRALAEMQTAVVLRNTATGSGARIRGSAAKGAVFTAITPISFGNRWSRIKPQSTVAGSGFGDLTIVLSPITANLPIRSTFVVTLPSTWTVTTNAFGCSASFGSALVSDSTIPMIASAPQVTPAESKVIRITSSQLAIARSSQIFRIFCSNAVRVPSIEAPSVEGPFISVFDASNMPLMQAPQVQLPAITAGASPVPIVMTRVMTAIPAQRRGGEFKITGKDAEVLHVVFANALNIPLTNAVVRSVLVGNDGITFDMALVPTASTSIEDIMDKITERGPALLSQLKSTMRMPVQSVQLPSETTLRATCADGLRNGDETDVDCGGASCLPCAETRTCSAAKDCELATCTSGRCAGRVNSAAGGASAMVAIAAAVIASIIMCMV